MCMYVYFITHTQMSYSLVGVHLAVLCRGMHSVYLYICMYIVPLCYVYSRCMLLYSMYTYECCAMLQVTLFGHHYYNT